ncbi:MAG: hypothetical protein ACI9QC_000222 [Oceanicoccus sp.]|jgi:hypothetical protein
MPMQDDPKNNPGFRPNQTPNEAQSEQALPHLKDSRSQMSTRLGDLEVERVDASDELERIRNQSASKVQDQTEIAQVGDDGSAFGDDGAGLMDLLREANLSPRHLRFCGGGIVIVLILIGFVFGGLKFVDWLGERPEKVANTPVVVEELLEDPDTKGTFTEVEDEIKYTDGTIYAGLLLGEEVTEEDPAVDAGELLGEELVSQDSLAIAITTFAELFDALQVDVNDLLDQSRDRQNTLDDYLGELKYLSYTGENELEDLRTITDNLSRQFTEVEAEKDLFELKFFDDLSDLDAYGATASLNEFVIRGEEVVNIRAQYLARLKLIEYYELVLTSMDRRITDIELNEEALVKGIQVVEIEGSDINLIIREDEL